MSRAAWAWVPAALWAGLLFFVSAQSSVPTPHIPGIDKVEHFAAYGVLCALVLRAVLASRLAPEWAVVLTSLYGVSDEIHQAFVPGRSADPRDWAADTLGALAVLLLFSRWRRTRAAEHLTADS